MASPNVVEVILMSANGLNYLPGATTVSGPYAVMWVDSGIKCSTEVSKRGATRPYWNYKLNIPMPGPVVGDTKLFIQIVHANDEKKPEKVIGSAQLNLWEVLCEVGVGRRVNRTLTLQLPSSGQHQGEVHVKVAVLEPRYGGYPPPAQPPSDPSFWESIATHLGVDLVVNAISGWFNGCLGGGVEGDYEEQSSLLNSYLPV